MSARRRLRSATVAALVCAAAVATIGAGRSVTPQVPVPAQNATPAQPAAPQSSQQTSQPNSQTPARPRPTFAVVIDAAHGGTDTGAALAANLAEKDVALEIARRIAHELQNRGIAATMVRSSDVALDREQRATAANSARATVYVAVHASNMGTGVRVYTAMMSPAKASVPRLGFVPWDRAQATHLDASSEIAGSIAFECNQRQLAVRTLRSSLPPLSNIAMAAIAVEVAKQSDDATSVTNSDYQQSVAAAVATGIAAVRARTEESR